MQPNPILTGQLISSELAPLPKFSGLVTNNLHQWGNFAEVNLSRAQRIPTDNETFNYLLSGLSGGVQQFTYILLRNKKVTTANELFKALCNHYPSSGSEMMTRHKLTKLK